jgi:hypothetical protein
MIALLEPVPAVHLPDAFKVQNAEGIVAFGTGAKSEVKSGEWSFQFFSKEELLEGKGILPVLIFGSATELKTSSQYHRPGYVTVSAIYEGWTPAKNWKHPRPEFRPKSALDGDTEWTSFWEVSHLKFLGKAAQIPLAKLKLSGKGALRPHSGIAPIGPQLVVLSEELAASIGLP